MITVIYWGFWSPIHDIEHVRVENVFSMLAAKPLYKAPAPSFRSIRKMRANADGLRAADLLEADNAESLAEDA